MDQRIPKVIHYCWFGGSPLPKSALRCIASWKKFFPGYIIKEWNESNFDVNIMPYTQEAYSAKKYAFVSDVARFCILYQEGGLYFDTDVEVVRNFEDVLSNGPFLGIETPIGGREPHPWINPGLGLGAEKGDYVIKKILDYYQTLHFCTPDGVQNGGTVVTHTTEILLRLGMKKTNEMQKVASFTIYPKDYFNPFDDATGVLNQTVNTHSIHWYAKSWIENYGPLRTFITRWIHRKWGVNSLVWLKKALNKN